MLTQAVHSLVILLFLARLKTKTETLSPYGRSDSSLCQRMWACWVSTDSYQVARIHIKEIGLLAAAAFQKVGGAVILFQVKVGFSQCECIQILCILLFGQKKTSLSL